MIGERELSPEETHLAFEPMRALRPHVTSVEEFVTRVNGDQRPEGYRLVASLDASGSAVSAAGFRRGCERLVHSLMNHYEFRTVR